METTSSNFVMKCLERKNAIELLILLLNGSSNFLSKNIQEMLYLNALIATGQRSKSATI